MPSSGSAKNRGAVSAESASSPSRSAADGNGKADHHNIPVREKDSPSKSSENEQKQQSERPSRLPDWITDNLKDPHSYKLWFRCWVASFVTLMLLPIDRALVTLGQAAFFACMVTFMIPSNMPVSIWLFANFTLVLGCCVGWAWGAASMAAGLRARNQVLLASSLKTVQSSVATATNPDAAYIQAIFRGAFLDPRSSAVSGAFLGIGAFFAAVVMHRAPKLKLFAIFSMIVLDIMVSYGPLFPIAQYTLATIFLLPIGASLGVAFGCIIFIFPESLNYSWTRSVVKLIHLQGALLDMHSGFVKEPFQADQKDDAAAEVDRFDAKVKGVAAGMVALSDALSGQAAFLELDVSRGRFSGKDLRKLLGMLRSLNLRLFGMTTFPHLLQDVAAGKHAQDQFFGNDGEASTESTSVGTAKNGQHDWLNMQEPVPMHYSHRLLRARKHVEHAEQLQGVELHTLQAKMAKAAEPTLAACRETLGGIGGWIERTNKRRWAFKVDGEVEQAELDKLAQHAANLHTTLERFVNEERFALIEPYRKHFKQRPDGSLYLDYEAEREFSAGARSLFIMLVWVYTLVNVAESVHNLAKEFHRMAVARQRNKIWLPSGLRKIKRIALSRKGATGSAFQVTEAPAPPTQSEDSDDEDDVTEAEAESTATKVDEEQPAQPGASAAEKRTFKQRRHDRRHRARHDPDALPPTKLVHRIGRAIAGVYNYLLSPEGMFGIRMAFVSIALWIPQVAPRSANFNYQNRGIWALIMGQTGLTFSVGEQIFSTIGRMFGTILGGLIGTAMWYISAGSSKTGNPYTYMLVGGIAFAVLIFFRIFSPPMFMLPAIMASVTSLLVYGYSWMDTHLAMRANVGVGIEVFWRRTLLVLIGIAAAFAVLLIGRPLSTRTLVRHSCSSITQDCLRIYHSIVESYILIESREGHRITDEERETLTKRLRAQFISAHVKLSQLATQQIGLASLDFSPRGPWPKARYEQAARAQARLLEALTQLALLLADEDVDEWLSPLVRRTALLDPEMISAIGLHLSLISRSLSLGTPMPHAGKGGLQDTLLAVQYRGRRLAKALGDEPQLTLAQLESPAFMRYTTGMVALSLVARAIDELSAVVCELTGEIPLDGFDELVNRREDKVWAAYSKGSHNSKSQ